MPEIPNVLSAEELQKRLQPTPPVDEADLENRKQGWLQNFQKMMTSDEGRAAMLQLGSSLLRPIQPGQTRGTNIADALDLSSQAYQKSRATQAQAKGAAQQYGLGAAGQVTSRMQAEAAGKKAAATAQGKKAAQVQIIDDVTRTIMANDPSLPEPEARAQAQERVLKDPSTEIIVETLSNNLNYVTGNEQTKKIIYDATIKAMQGVTSSPIRAAETKARERRTKGFTPKLPKAGTTGVTHKEFEYERDAATGKLVPVQ